MVVGGSPLVALMEGLVLLAFSNQSLMLQNVQYEHPMNTTSVCVCVCVCVSVCLSARARVCVCMCLCLC